MQIFFLSAIDVNSRSLQTYGKECFYLDTNSNTSLAWSSMTDMPAARAHFPFVTYGRAAYAIGGYYGSGEFKLVIVGICVTRKSFPPCSRVDRWSETEGWQQMASYPVNTHRHCAAADEGRDRIYVVGGVNDRHRVSYYRPSTNTWHGFTSTWLQVHLLTYTCHTPDYRCTTLHAG